MTFRSQTLTDFLNTILNTDEMAESISYTPNGSAAITIKAIINRSPLQSNAADNGMTLTDECEVFVANDATYGVTTVTKNDTLSFPKRIGDSNSTWRVIEIVEKDDAAWRLRVRK